jgi:hypothetical protein
MKIYPSGGRMLKIFLALVIMIFFVQFIVADEPTATEMELLENQEQMLKNQEEILQRLDSRRGFKDRDILNVMSMPTAFALKKNEFIIGLGSVFYGISNHLQVGSNLLLFLLQDRNIMIKSNLYNTSKHSFAAGLRYDYFALKTYGINIDYTFLSPYCALSHSMSEKAKLHISGQYSMSWNSEDADIEDAEPNWFSQGSNTALGMDINVSNRTKFVGELAYDYTYKGTRAGCAVIWGWEKLRLKFGINSYTYDNNGNIILPSFNIWWRFDG